jgi:hypothetical protein
MLAGGKQSLGVNEATRKMLGKRDAEDRMQAESSGNYEGWGWLETSGKFWKARSH